SSFYPRQTLKVPLNSERSDRYPFLCLAFKLEASKFGQLTYIRVYQGCLHRGDTVINTRNGRRIRIARLGRVHVTSFEELEVIYAGDIAAFFGVDCLSGDTLVDTKMGKSLSMASSNAFYANIYPPNPFHIHTRISTACTFCAPIYSCR
ncbi:unnamed protein product, partial [Dicrocoelium dendriticum]